MKSLTIFAWWLVIMTLSGALWYFTQWWFVLFYLIVNEAGQVALWAYANHCLARDGCNWRYSFSFMNHLCLFDEADGLEYYWIIDEPTPKDLYQLRKRSFDVLAKRKGWK